MMIATDAVVVYVNRKMNGDDSVDMVSDISTNYDRTNHAWQYSLGRLDPSAENTIFSLIIHFMEEF